ncbi:MAG: cytochrome ubiquinol oxidase subunit I [Desulfosarcinaceae bacterium]
MNYPVWDLATTGGGFWIALVAVTHVFVSHFAVGGGLWLVMVERRARRTGDAALRSFLKGHARFFLLLTMVFGGISGVGIWWTIALLNPSATSTLIHTFVFGWAAEWVCFLGEIVALLVYYYKFDTMAQRDHEIIGWFYFVFAWLSLFLISGIIAFMLTPGGWLENGNFWSGFFNESFWPSVVFRTSLAAMIAGMFGMLTGAWQRDTGLRQRVVRYSAVWVLAPFVVMILSGLWYVRALPEAQETMILERAREVAPWLRRFVWLTPMLLIGGLLAVAKLPRSVHQLLAVAVALLGFAHMGSFEFVREAGRRPWVIHGFMYANAVTRAEAAELQEAPFLQTARWARVKTVDNADPTIAGGELFRLQCSACHAVGGPMNDIVPLTAEFTEAGLDAQLVGQGRVAPYMPPFFGNAEERRALAAYLRQKLHGRPPETPPAAEPQTPALDIPPFDAENDEYVLLAWNNMGMHCLSDSDPWWVILPPANDLHAQLIRRGELPEVVTEEVTLVYRVEAGFEHPEKQVSFWKHARSNFGLDEDLPEGVGLSGNRVSGEMKLDEEKIMFAATLIPMAPYRDGRYHPYPICTVEARERQSGQILARTRVVVPTSTEMGCAKCHGGGWRVENRAGFTEETARRILKVHDKHSGTGLLAAAEAGKPRLCQSCHQDPVLGTAGQPGLLNFPAAIHGWHANYLTGQGADACAMCHPSDPAGPTTCLRGAHADSLDCTHCHGTLEDHALSLLKKENEAGKAGAERLMAHLAPRTVADLEEVVGRTPWLQQPDCTGCHTEAFIRPDPGEVSAFNQWTGGFEELYRVRTDDTGSLQCAACHGAPHAVYPAFNRWYGHDRDNLQPLQYQGNRRPIGAQGHCTVCHGIEMDFSVHHEGMIKSEN